MAQDHHHHESPRDYFVEQLLTIFVVGLFGAVAILMYNSGRLQFVLAPQFHVPVLIGGIAILMLVAVRAFSVWREAGMIQAHTHEHNHHDHDHGHDHHHGQEHGPDCNHEHGADCGHEHHHDHTHHHHDHSAEDHGHSHDMAWVLARMMVLFFPVALFLVGLPNAGFSQDRINKLLGNDVNLDLSQLGSVSGKEGTVMSFNDLNDAAYDEGKRQVFQGQTAVLEGKFRRLGDKDFTLYRLRMTCCAADTIPLKVRIAAPYALSGFNEAEWVRVRGQIQFIQVPNSSQYVPVIRVGDNSDIEKVQPRNEYE